MLIDTSVLVMIYRRESGFNEFLDQISKATHGWISVVSYLEFVIVTKDQLWIDGFLKVSQIQMLEVSKRDIEEAVSGFFRYGKGRGKNPAALNFGDCIVYGTAKANNMNLLFKGDDFAKTDIASAKGL